MSADHILVDEEILNKFGKLDELAKLCNVIINVTRSFTKLLNPTDMVINSFATFTVGRGIEIVVMGGKNNKEVICDKFCLGSKLTNSFLIKSLKYRPGKIKW